MGVGVVIVVVDGGGGASCLSRVCKSVVTSDSLQTTWNTISLTT